MLECLILYSLLDRDLTTYKIRKSIIDSFEIFSKPSLGAIHPALIKLAEKKCVETAKIMSDGGQKSMFHHITNEGRKKFYQMFSSINSTMIPKISVEIKIKIAMLPAIANVEAKQKFLENAQKALELAGYDIRNSMEKNTCGFYQTSASLMYKDIAGLTSTVEKLRKEGLE